MKRQTKLFALGTGAILYGLFFAGADAKREAEAIARWGLDEHQAAVMRECKTSMKRHGKSYRQNVSITNGCACIAQHLGKQVRPENFQYASNVFDIMVEAATSDKMLAQLFKKLRTDQTLDGLPVKERYELSSTVSGAIRYCGSAENHIVDDKTRTRYLKAKTERRLSWQER